MFERFTDRARKILQLANQEAQRRNRATTGTEDVLLGMVKEGSGVAANVLKNLGVELRNIRVAVEAVHPPPAGEPLITMQRLPHTDGVKQIFEFAKEEAAAIGDTYIGTEHLLLGMIRVENSTAADVLGRLGITAEAVRAESRRLLGKPAKFTGQESPNELLAVRDMLTTALAAVNRMLGCQTMTWTVPLIVTDPPTSEAK